MEKHQQLSGEHGNGDGIQITTVGVDIDDVFEDNKEKQTVIPHSEVEEGEQDQELHGEFSTKHETENGSKGEQKDQEVQGNDKLEQVKYSKNPEEFKIRVSKVIEDEGDIAQDKQVQYPIEEEKNEDSLCMEESESKQKEIYVVSEIDIKNSEENSNQMSEKPADMKTIQSGDVETRQESESTEDQKDTCLNVRKRSWEESSPERKSDSDTKHNKQNESKTEVQTQSKNATEVPPSSDKTADNSDEMIPSMKIHAQSEIDPKPQKVGRHVSHDGIRKKVVHSPVPKKKLRTISPETASNQGLSDGEGKKAALLKVGESSQSNQGLTDGEVKKTPLLEVGESSQSNQGLSEGEVKKTPLLEVGESSQSIQGLSDGEVKKTPLLEVGESSQSNQGLTDGEVKKAPLLKVGESSQDVEQDQNKKEEENEDVPSLPDEASNDLEKSGQLNTGVKETNPSNKESKSLEDTGSQSEDNSESTEVKDVSESKDEDEDEKESPNSPAKKNINITDPIQLPVPRHEYDLPVLDDDDIEDVVIPVIPEVVHDVYDMNNIGHALVAGDNNGEGNGGNEGNGHDNNGGDQEEDDEEEEEEEEEEEQEEEEEADAEEEEVVPNQNGLYENDPEAQLLVAVLELQHLHVPGNVQPAEGENIPQVVNPNVPIIQQIPPLGVQPVAVVQNLPGNDGAEPVAGQYGQPEPQEAVVEGGVPDAVDNQQDQQVAAGVGASVLEHQNLLQNQPVAENNQNVPDCANVPEIEPQDDQGNGVNGVHGNPAALVHLNVPIEEQIQAQIAHVQDQVVHLAGNDQQPVNNQMENVNIQNNAQQQDPNHVSQDQLEAAEDLPPQGQEINQPGSHQEVVGGK